MRNHIIFSHKHYKFSVLLEIMLRRLLLPAPLSVWQGKQEGWRGGVMITRKNIILQKQNHSRFYHLNGGMFSFFFHGMTRIINKLWWYLLLLRVSSSRGIVEMEWDILNNKQLCYSFHNGTWCDNKTVVATVFRLNFASHLFAIKTNENQWNPKLRVNHKWDLMCNTFGRRLLVCWHQKFVWEDFIMCKASFCSFMKSFFVFISVRDLWWILHPSGEKGKFNLQHGEQRLS